MKNTHLLPSLSDMCVLQKRQTALGKKDCPKAILIPPVSLFHTSDMILATPQLPNKPGHPHKINLVSNAPSYRNGSNGFSHSTRRLFFCASLRITSRAFVSPKTPLISALGLNPENRYSSSRRLFFLMQVSYSFFALRKPLLPLILCYVAVNSWLFFTHSIT